MIGLSFLADPSVSFCSFALSLVAEKYSYFMQGLFACLPFLLIVCLRFFSLSPPLSLSLALDSDLSAGKTLRGKHKNVGVLLLL
jgi:hypothetical protein